MNPEERAHAYDTSRARRGGPVPRAELLRHVLAPLAERLPDGVAPVCDPPVEPSGG
ncbi:hypothetical protein NC315_26800 [Streptomyces sp. G2]|uniref:hypothetical protein n=1 Tax=Streptomyces sp. G2 TaxID=1684471 RepID=UPI00202F1712|nr:hypothetical protein [Streptomyces sp. G2]MCM1948957.1 hypothetical protein [Streptomyces sp. G2]